MGVYGGSSPSLLDPISELYPSAESCGAPFLGCVYVLYLWFTMIIHD